MVVAAGGGQLDDFWGGALAHPYTLWRFGGMARAVGARFVLLRGVGTGNSRHTLEPVARAAHDRARTLRSSGMPALATSPAVRPSPGTTRSFPTWPMRCASRTWTPLGLEVHGP